MPALLLAIAAAVAAVVGTPAGVVRDYYARLAAHDYAGARRFWPAGAKAAGPSLAAFARGFAGTRATRVTITGPIAVEGGAGSLYATVPVRVDAVEAGGGHRRYVGYYVVRRVNGVDGASAAQLRWHLDSARLRPAG